MKNESTALVPKNRLESWFVSRVEETMEVLPGDDDRTKRTVLRSLQDFCRNPPEMLRGCEDKNVFEEVLKAARLGLTLNDALHHASLIPFKSKGVKRAQLIIEYRGLARVMRNSGLVKAIHTGLIHEADSYEWTESDFKLQRRLGDRGEIVGAYCVLDLSDGTRQTEVMSVVDVEHVRSKSRAKDSGPWVSDWGQMARKTVLRRAANLVDWSPDDARQLQRSDRTEFTYDDSASVEVKEGSVKKVRGGSKAVFEAASPEPEPEPVAKAPRPAWALHLKNARALRAPHKLPEWQSITEPRKKLIRERMEDLSIKDPGELWAKIDSALANLTPAYYENWTEAIGLDVLIRVPKRGNTDHFTKLLEGQVVRTVTHAPLRTEGSPPVSDALLDLMGEEE